MVMDSMTLVLVVEAIRQQQAMVLLALFTAGKSSGPILLYQI
jgi:hypothetical protein